MTKLRFPEWCYGGPFVRIDDPDVDSPRRDMAFPITAHEVAHAEFEGLVGGERMVAPFHDANSIGDILGLFSYAEGYPQDWDDEEIYCYPTIQGLIGEVVLRLEAKMRRRPGRIRANWFGLALDHVRVASALFAAHDRDGGLSRLREAQGLVEQGNGAPRRRVTFVVGPDGSARKV